MILAYPNETTGYIGFFMVDKSRQGQGIGSRIVADIENTMRNNGMRHSRLAVDKGTVSYTHLVRFIPVTFCAIKWRTLPYWTARMGMTCLLYTSRCV